MITDDRIAAMDALQKFEYDLLYQHVRGLFAVGSMTGATDIRLGRDTTTRSKSSASPAHPRALQVVKS